MTVIHHPEHLVDRVAMEAIRSTLGSAKGSIDGPDARKAFDEIMGQVPAASKVAYEAAIVGGVPGWWCRPDKAMKGAAILYFHGGGYVVGTSHAYRHFVGQVAVRAKVAAFVPGYGLAPEYPFPAAVEDAQAIYEGLFAEGFTNIALAGDSAGGGLALVLLSSAVAKARAGASPIPKGAAVMSPWTDLALAGESMVTRAQADPLSTPAQLAAMARLYLAGRDPHDPLASPLYDNLAGLPPVRIDVGEDDVLLDDSTRYGERFEREGGTIQVHTWEGMTHVFPSNVALLAAREALDDIGDFLNRQLREGLQPARKGCTTKKTQFNDRSRKHIMPRTVKTEPTSVRQHQPDQDRFHAIRPEDVQWRPFPAFPPEARLAILVGNPAKSGSYVIRVKLPAGTKMMPHKHPEDRIYTVLSGTFYIGLGEVFDESKLTAFEPGTVVVLPGGQPHFHWAKSGEYITQVSAIGPLGLSYVEIADDPRT